MTIAINTQMKMDLKNKQRWMKITNRQYRRSIKNRFSLKRKRKNIMFLALVPKSNRTGMKSDPLNREILEIINLLEIKESRDLSLQRTMQAATEFNLLTWTKMMMKINNKCRCQFMTKDKKILRNISSQNNFSIKMWVKKETFNNLTILKTIKCIETELDLCHSQDQRCQVDRAINSWIKMATIKGMTEIRWTCKGRMRSTTKT